MYSISQIFIFRLSLCQTQHGLIFQHLKTIPEELLIYPYFYNFKIFYPTIFPHTFDVYMGVFFKCQDDWHSASLFPVRLFSECYPFWINQNSAYTLICVLPTNPYWISIKPQLPRKPTSRYTFPHKWHNPLISRVRNVTYTTAVYLWGIFPFCMECFWSNFYGPLLFSPVLLPFISGEIIL